MRLKSPPIIVSTAIPTRLLRLGLVERPARHQLGQSYLHSQSGILLLPTHHPALSKTAAEKYGTLDALNKAWYRRFQSWSEVEPDRLSTILSCTDYIDWKHFIIDKLGEDLRERYDAVRKAARPTGADVAMTAAGPAMALSGAIQPGHVWVVHLHARR